MKISKNSILILLMALIFGLSSCLTRKNEKLIYFKSLETNSVSNSTLFPKESIIKPSDILQISVFSLDVETSKILNNVSTADGFMVDDSGRIKLPLLGNIKAGGLNKIQLADTISKKLIQNQLMLSPIVNVRITNFKITILGEVNKPGVVTVPNEHITITEALGMAGDLTIYGNRENILLIREKDGKRITKRFSLNNNEIFSTDIFYLQNQDVLYVESTHTKAAPLSRFTQNLSLFLTTVSFILLIYTTSKTIK